MNAEAPHRPLSSATGTALDPREIARAGRAELLLAQWSRGTAEIIAVLHKPGFEQAVLQAVRRLVDFCFVMTFAYAGPRGPWRTLGPSQDGTILSTRRAGGFVGAVFGPFAVSGSPTHRSPSL